MTSNPLRLATPYIPLKTAQNPNLVPRHITPLANSRASPAYVYNGEVSQGTQPYFMGLSRKYKQRNSFVAAQLQQKTNSSYLPPIEYTPYYSKKRDRTPDPSRPFMESAMSLLSPGGPAKPSIHLKDSHQPSLNPTLLALKMLTEQEKLKEAILTTQKGKEYSEILKEHQNLTLGMISTIEEQRQTEKESKMQYLMNRIEALENEKAQQNLYSDYYNYSSQLQSQRNMQRKSRAAKAKKLATLNEEELKKNKDFLLSQKERRTDLLKAMGLGEDPAEDSKAPADSNNDTKIMFDKEMLQNRLRTLGGRKQTKAKALRPIQKFRGIAKAIKAWLTLYKYMKVNVAKLREEMITFMRYDISLHLDVSRAWLLQCIRPVLLSVILSIIMQE